MSRVFFHLKLYERRILLILVLLTILLRSVYVTVDYARNGTTKWVDDMYYLKLGEQITTGDLNLMSETSASVIVGPVIPLLVALFIILFNEPVIPMFIYNIISTSLFVIVLFYLGRELFNDKVGWFMSIWGVLFIECFKYSSHILKEPTLFLCVPLTLLLLIKSIKKNYSLKYLLSSALSYSFLIHTDERFLIYLPIFAFSFFLVKPLTLSNFYRPILTWLAFVLILMLPWGMRNYLVYDQVVIITPRTTAFTSKFWGSNLAGKASHFEDDDVRDKFNRSRYESALQFGNEYGITPRKFSNPEARYRAFINFWQPAYFSPTFIQYGYRIQKWSFRHNVSSLIFYGIFLPFYFLGIFALLKRKLFLALFVALIPVLHSLIHAYMVWPIERYRSPVTFIIVLVGFWYFLEVSKYVVKSLPEVKHFMKDQITILDKL